MTENLQTQTKNRRTLSIILVVSIAPIALAWIAFFTGIGVPQSTANHGVIINPALRVDTLLNGINEGHYKGLLKNKKWHIFIPVSEQCGEQCQSILHLTRQVHIRLGEKGPRLDRTVLKIPGKNDDRFREDIEAGHPNLHYLEIDEQHWLDWQSQSPVLQAQQNPFYLLVDQEGFAMMLYNLDIDGGDLLKDIKRALRHSIDYQ